MRQREAAPASRTCENPRRMRTHALAANAAYRGTPRCRSRSWRSERHLLLGLLVRVESRAHLAPDTQESLS
eukprot:6173652-Pleurochrysis_carterae.AAC.18